MKLNRSVERWEKCDPSAIAVGSDAQCMYCIKDARADILSLAAFVERIARLNRDAGEIGAGMLASLIDDARSLLE